ncbi:MAG: response regulator [Chitinophagaceae bacterium]|nr:response regulator [Oligoflexus sp.]
MEFARLALVKPLRILLAEDNKVNQILTLGLLRSLGYTCELAIDGRQAVESALASSYDLVLMDCQLPVIDGYKAARLIKDQNPRTIVVAYTAAIREHDTVRSKGAGMEFTLSKPIAMESLVDLLTSVYDILHKGSST